MANMEYITDFLKRVEGNFTRLYIPCYKKSGGTANYFGGANPGNYQAMGASGCTVGVGCDLGQTSEAELLGYGLDPAVAAIFGPYYGLKKDAAIRALYAAPLTVSTTVADALSRAVHTGYLNKYVRPAYDKEAKIKFDKLPKQAQAVVMSVCYQKGVGGVKRDWPRTWRFLVGGDWGRAASELKFGFAQYLGRRRIEGQLLEELL